MMRDGTESLKIQGTVLSGMADFMDGFGLSFADAAQTVGLELTDAEDENSFIKLDRFAKLLEVGALLSNDDVFGLRFAMYQDVAAAGPLAYAMRNAPTVGDGLIAMVRYIGTRVDVAHMELVVDGNRAKFEWLISPLIFNRTHLTDYAAVSIVRRTAQMIDPAWRPLAAHLERPAPRNAGRHRRVFGRLVHFDQPMNSLTIDASTLDLPVIDADPQMEKIAVELLQRRLAERRYDNDLVTQLREEIIWSLEQEAGPEIGRMARRLGLSERTLQRRLSEERTSFQSLVDSTRRHLALSYLEDPRMSLSQVSFRLGFSASSAFTRACRRWFSATPREKRAVLLAAKHRHKF